MTLDEMNLLYDYGAWAQHRIFRTLSTLSSEELHRKRGTSHESMFATFVHIVSAEEVWLKRWNGEPDARLRGPDEWTQLDDVRSFSDSVESAIKTFLSSLKTDTETSVIIQYKNIAGKPFQHPLSLLFLHLVNHSTYHRGQIAAMIRQSGAKPEATDFVVFLRERGI